VWYLTRTSDPGDFVLPFMWIHIPSTLHPPAVLDRACDDPDGHSWTSGQATMASAGYYLFCLSLTLRALSSHRAPPFDAIVL